MSSLPPTPAVSRRDFFEHGPGRALEAAFVTAWTGRGRCVTACVTPPSSIGVGSLREVA